MKANEALFSPIRCVYYYIAVKFWSTSSGSVLSDLKRGRAKTYFDPTALKRGRAMARVAPPLPDFLHPCLDLNFG